jgi:hypothetical protein
LHVAPVCHLTSHSHKTLRLDNGGKESTKLEHDLCRHSLPLVQGKVLIFFMLSGNPYGFIGSKEILVLMQSVVVLFPLWNESTRTRLQPQCLLLSFESIGSALAAALVAGGCNKVVFFVQRTDSNLEVSQHFLSFVGSTSNLYISSSISS